MKCLEKERGRRYETANGLAMDVQRYLTDEPVAAGPPSAGYRLRKFVRRYRKVLFTAAFFVILLLAGVVGSTWQAIRATTAEALAQSRFESERLARESEKEARDALDRTRHEKEEQQTRANRDLSETLAEAAGLREKALAARVSDQVPWNQLRETVRRAETLADGGLADPVLVARVQVLTIELKQEEVDRRVMARLEEIRLNKGNHQGQGLVTVSNGALEPYAAAFRDYGIGLPLFGSKTLERDIEESARRIAASRIQDSLVAALDDCASNHRPLCKVLLPIARRCVKDPWRQHYFDARIRNDRPALVQLSKQPEALAQPTATICMLASAVFGIDEPTALELLRETQRRYPGDFWVNEDLASRLLGLSWSRGAQPEEAVACSRAALALRPESVALHAQLGHAFHFARRFDDAAAVFRRLIENQKDQHWAYHGLGQALFGKKDYTRAIAAYRKAIELNAEFGPSYQGLADALREGGNIDGGIDVWRKRIAIAPQDVQAHRELGFALAAKGQLEPAIASYQKAIALNPKDVGVYHNLAFALSRKDDFAGAIAAYRKANEITPSAWAHLQLAQARLTTGEIKAAAEESRKALELSPENVENWVQHAPMLLLAGDAKGYRQLCARALKRFGGTTDTEIGFQVARLCSLAGGGASDPAPAVSLARKGVAEHRNAWRVHTLGLAQYRAGEFGAAIELVDESLAVDPDWQGVCCNWLVLAMAHHRLGRAKEAERWLDKAAEWMDHKSLKTGKQYVGPLAEIAPHDWLEGRVLRREAEALLKMDADDLAIADYRRAVALNPKDAGAYYNLGNVLRKKRDFPAAADAYRKVVELTPNDAGAYHNLGIVLGQTPDLDAAAAAYRKSIELHPTDPLTYHNLAIALAKRGKGDEAIAAYRKVIALDPKNAGAHRGLAGALDKKGNLAEAITIRRQVVELNPKDAGALNELAWFLASCPDVKLRDPAGAVRYARRAVELSPKDGLMWNTLGVAQHYAGDWQAAVTALENSLGLLAGQLESTNTFFLAMAHWQLGHKQEALKWYGRAVEWTDRNQPGDEELRRFRVEAARLLMIEDKAQPAPKSQ